MILVNIVFGESVGDAFDTGLERFVPRSLQMC